MRDVPAQTARMRWRLILTGMLLLGACGSTAAQDRPEALNDFFAQPVVPRDLSVRFDLRSAEPACPLRSDAVRLFSMASAIPQTPLGLDADDETPGSSGADAITGDDRRLQVVLGTDNPFYDFRRRGDPGGAGYYKFYSQALLFDTSSTAFSIGFQATTPAGLESDGIATGPTHFSPNMAWFYDLGGGHAFHAFLGQNLRARTQWNNGVMHSTRYGLAWQSPCPGVKCNADHGVNLFVEALGRFRYDNTTSQRPNMEFLPGIQWRLSQNWWFSGGYLIPMGTTNAENRVQINCTWRF